MQTYILTMVILCVSQLSERKTGNDYVNSISEVISNIAANEKMLSDMDAKWTVNWKLIKKDFEFTGAISQRTSKCSCVIQGQLFRIERTTEGETLSKNEHKVHKIYAYDGSKTRSKSNDIINVQDSLVNHRSNAFRPHVVLLDHIDVELPLSIWIKGGNDLKAHPDAGYYKSQYNVDSSVIGMETIRGIRCMKIKSKLIAIDNGYNNNEIIIWLSPMHNYLPIRMEGYSPKVSPTIPITIGEVLTFKEIEGIWLPAAWKQTVYDHIEIKKSGTRRELGTYEGTLDSIDLHPKYDVEFFRNFDYPTGAIYYELNAAGKITLGGSIHRDAKTGFFSWSSTTYTIVLLTILLILFLVYLFRNRVFRFSYA